MIAVALITFAQFKEHVPQLQGGTDQTLVETLISRADALMAAFCEFPVYDGGIAPTLEAQDYTLYVEPRADDARALDLRLRPIIDVTSVHVSEDWSFGSTDEVDSGDYIRDDQRGVLWLKPTASASWSSDARANKVVVTAGFETTPPNLVAITAFAARHLYMPMRHSPEFTNVAGKGFSATKRDAEELLPAAVREALAPLILWSRRLS